MKKVVGDLEKCRSWAGLMCDSLSSGIVKRKIVGKKERSDVRCYGKREETREKEMRRRARHETGPAMTVSRVSNRYSKDNPEAIRFSSCSDTPFDIHCGFGSKLEVFTSGLLVGQLSTVNSSRV